MKFLIKMLSQKKRVKKRKKITPLVTGKSRVEKNIWMQFKFGIFFYSVHKWCLTLVKFFHLFKNIYKLCF